MGKEDDHWAAWKARPKPQRTRTRVRIENDRPPKPHDEMPSRGLKPSADAVKRAIKLAILANQTISTDEIKTKLELQFGSWGSISRVTIWNIKEDFRHSLKLIANWHESD